MQLCYFVCVNGGLDFFAIHFSLQHYRMAACMQREHLLACNHMCDVRTICKHSHAGMPIISNCPHLPSCYANRHIGSDALFHASLTMEGRVIRALTVQRNKSNAINK